MELSERIREVLPNMPAGAGNEMLSGTGQILYLNYDLDKPLISQVKENGNLAMRMISMVEKMVSMYEKEKCS